jgi:hypothetical protein
VDLELGRALEDGWTPPAAWYSEPAVLQAERDRIFTSTWQYAGPLHQSRGPARSSHPWPDTSRWSSHARATASSARS